ncbi:SagB family peptide dehydrogenase [Streptomyces oceani]|uniref:Nitroreductase n=1 Tax=Streptomyces oceani TaxID=1075402 RepID=A0A1E7KJM7_9ACTN|nr:SagB family peptide dehydrogenase [Streptomyces oceani]OEV04093.1 nitroreductase [Streptomyces oceani]
MGYAHEYATAIMHRGRIPMEPTDFVPDWADGPRKGKFYPGVERVPLPDGDYPAAASLDDGLRPAGDRPVDDRAAGDRTTGGFDGQFDLAALAGMLRDSYGLTGRRLGVQANTDLSALPHYPLANWSRGSASGGGLYPVTLYWISGASGPLTPGVHHYSARHHALERLLTGDVTGLVRDALGPAAPGADTDQYFVLGVKYWQNAFKYNSFSFHAVSMDVGACLQTWRMWAGARGLAVEPLLWFDEERLARLLGVDSQEEGVFAVVPLRWADQGGPAGSGTSTSPAAPAAPTPTPVRVRPRDSERSRRVLSFEALRAMQTATLGHARARPAAGALRPAAALPPDQGRLVRPLPAARPMDLDVRSALRRRRSSFGRFAAGSPVTAEQLAACLAAADAGALLGGDSGTGHPPHLPHPAGTATPDGPVQLAKLYAFVNHVADVPPGSYEYDPHQPDGPALRQVTPGSPGEFLQRNYFLANYNLEQAGVVLVPTVRTTAVLGAVGERGYRLVNAVVGAIAQAVYTASAALDLGCGVALGFDNVSYVEELGLRGTEEAPLLIMMIGNERPRPADFRFEIV